MEDSDRVCRLFVPCDPRYFKRLMKSEETKQSTSLIVTHNGRRGSTCNPYIRLQGAIEHLPCALDSLTVDCRLQHENEKTHAHDLSNTLSPYNWDLENLTLQGMRIDGTIDDMETLGGNIYTIRGQIALEGIEPFDSSVRMDKLMHGICSRRIVRLKKCPWATGLLGQSRYPCVNELVLDEVSGTDLEPIIAEMLKDNKSMQKLEIRNIIKQERATTHNDLGAMLKNNSTLESLTIGCDDMRDACPILNACQSSNRALKDINFIFETEDIGSLEMLKSLVNRVMKSNTVIQNLSFQGPSGIFIADAVPMEARWYLKLNQLGRESLLGQFGANDAQWLGALTSNAGNDDISTIFFLLNNNPALLEDKNEPDGAESHPKNHPREEVKSPQGQPMKRQRIEAEIVATTSIR